MSVAPTINVEAFYTGLIKDLGNGTLALPTLPEVAMEVRKIVDDPRSSASDVAKVIITDAALSTKLVKVANSPLFRGEKEVESVQIAIARMGVNVIRNLVTSLMMKQLFTAKSPIITKKMRKIWDYNTQIAGICHVLGSTCSTVESDDSMLAGLIYNIGALPILMRADETPEILADTVLLDRLVYKLSSHIGKKILEAWFFPQSLIDVAAEHADLTRDKHPEADLVDIVQVAFMGTAHPFGEVDWARVPALAKLGFTAEIEEVELEGCTEKIEAIQSMLV